MPGSRETTQPAGLPPIGAEAPGWGPKPPVDPEALDGVQSLVP